MLHLIIIKATYSSFKMTTMILYPIIIKITILLILPILVIK